MDSESGLMEAYLDDLKMRLASSFGIPSYMLEIEPDQMSTGTLKRIFTDREKYYFPCPIDGKCITTAECWDCERSNNCDIYATMLDEDFD